MLSVVVVVVLAAFKVGKVAVVGAVVESKEWDYPLPWAAVGVTLPVIVVVVGKATVAAGGDEELSPPMLGCCRCGCDFIGGDEQLSPPTLVCCR